MKKKAKKLTLAKETLSGLERLVHGGSLPVGCASYPYCQYSDPIACGGGGGDTSAGFYANPESCQTKTTG